MEPTQFRIIDKGVEASPSFSIEPGELVFGKRFAANMFECRYADGKWGNGELKEFENFVVHPAAIVFHYGQALFEGLKAYRAEDGRVLLFRPELNANRLNRSAKRLEMPTFPEEHFLQAVELIVRKNKNFIPNIPGNLYIRPTMIGIEPCIGVRAANELLFFIIALPTGNYFKTGMVGAGSVDVLISEDVARAAAGGTGSVKAAANYAISLQTINEAKKVGCSQVLFLDAAEKKYLEELGGMNIFFSDGKKLVTPSLTDTILAGITRQSIIELAPTLGMAVEERKLSLEEVVSSVKAGIFTEALACGTAAVATGIQSLKFSKRTEILTFPAVPGPVTSMLYDALTKIQYGQAEDKLGWVREVKL